MFHYTICNVPDKTIFQKQCIALEKHIPGLKRIDFLHDVDDSLIQKYEKDNAKIKVTNDYYVGGVFIESDIELEPYFKK